MNKLFVLVLITGLLSACGFHPRGVASIPEGSRTMFLQAPTALRDELGVYLVDGGANIVDSREGAEFVLEVKREDFDSRTLSVDPDTGKEREFELTYTVTFLARAGDGSVLMKQQTITLLRDYVLDADRLIGKSREKRTLQEEMRRDAAQQILARINSTLGA